MHPAWSCSARNVYIVFVTAYEIFAPDGYRVNAIRYLVKGDIQFQKKMEECLETIIDRTEFANRKHLFTFRQGSVELLDKDIIYMVLNLVLCLNII